MWIFCVDLAVFFYKCAVFKSILGKSGNQHRRVKRKERRGKRKVKREGEKGRNTWT